MKLLIDADILTYKIGFRVEEMSKFRVKTELDVYINELLKDTNTKEHQLFLTGKGNFRHTVTDTYKANRKDAPKPKHYTRLRDLMVRDWGALVIDGMEADDALGLAQAEDTMIASIDKDLLIVEGKHFNLNSRLQTLVTPEEGDRFFYKQMLMGDNVDNIKAIKGVGTKTADKLLDATDRDGWDDMIMGKYEDFFGEVWYQRFVENTQLLWILNKREMPIKIEGYL